MRKFICSFDRAQYLAGQNIVITFPLKLDGPEIKLYRLQKEIVAACFCDGEKAVLTGVAPGNYGVTVQSGNNYWEGAFDVVDSQRSVTRYGFLADFTKEDCDDADVTWMKDLHINAIQFYDWMYRHDELLPPSEVYRDPLGREMSLSTVRRKTELCKAMGIRPFAYGAVYAATKETFEMHPDWGMYAMNGEPLVFADWLNFMNISAGTGWTGHLLEEYKKAIMFGFQGIHMDTYGFPKHVWSAEGKPVELEQEFPRLIEEASGQVRQADDKAGVIFNAVNNWPVEAVAKANQDAVYIEVWPPNNTFYDLYTLIRNARTWSGRCVVLAAYMKPFLDAEAAGAERALRFTWAAISASGGTQLVFGENHSVLRDSYYVNYARLREGGSEIAQKYCDFLVRYADLMYADEGSDVSKTAACGINEDICFEAGDCHFSADAAADTVWVVIRESQKRISLHLINLCGNDNLWNTEKREPERVSDITLKFRLDRPLSGIYCASPDNAVLSAEKLACSWEQSFQGRIYTVKIPKVEYWTAVWVEVEE